MWKRNRGRMKPADPPGSPGKVYPRKPDGQGSGITDRSLESRGSEGQEGGLPATSAQAVSLDPHHTRSPYHTGRSRCLRRHTALSEEE